MTDIVSRIAEVMHVGKAERAIVYRGDWWTWQDCRRFGDALDAMIATYLDPVPGTTIAVIMRNRPPQVAAILCALTRRYCLVPVSPLQSARRVAEELQALRPAVVMGDAEDIRGPAVESAVGDIEALGLTFDGYTAAPFVLPPRRSRAAARRDVAVWMPTSGTTGPPKRVEITYRDLSIGFDRVRTYSSRSQQAGRAAGLSHAVALSCTPLVHIAGLWGVIQFAIEGRRLAMLDRFEPGPWADLVAGHAPVVAMLPPAALTMLLDSDVDADKLRSLRAILCSTAALPPDAEARFTDRFGIPVLTTYGATEFPGGLTGWTLDLKRQFGAAKVGSVGRPRAGVDIRVVAQDTGEAVAAGSEGLIEVRSAQTVARGAEGWVRTTDLGRLDDDGFLWVTGRADGAINRGGFKMLPETIESALLKHPRVRAVSVVGVPDPRLGQVPVAGVEVRGATTEAELMMWAREHLLKYQVPARIAIVESLPKTPSMKISRPDVLAMFVSPSPGIAGPARASG
jgi:acyl-CoA synthetase (AMP-forming)/AMP-acid ligase II